MIMPAPAALTLPANDATLQPNRPIFDWDDVPGAASYTLQVSTVNTFASFVLNQSTIESTYIPAKDLPANKLLFWRVIANGANGPSLPSGFLKFTTANPPSMPVLSAPADNLLIANTLTLKLDWANVTVPVGITLGGYQLEVATDTAFSSAVLTQNVTSTIGTPPVVVSEFTLTTPLSSNTKYYWHVRSYDSGSHYSSWSLVRSFRMIMPAPTALTLPSNGTTLQTVRPSSIGTMFPAQQVTPFRFPRFNTFASFALNTLPLVPLTRPSKTCPQINLSSGA